MPKVLLVEDDTYLAKVVGDALVASNIEVDESADGLQAAEWLRTVSYDVLILDWELPGLEGVELLRQFRQRRGATPTIIITGRRAIDEKGFGFDAGADDYLAKPFNVRELVMRVQALLRRPAVAVDHCLSIAGVELNMRSFSATRDGEKLDLSRKEMQLLEYFMRRPTMMLSAEALLCAVWGTDAEASVGAVRIAVTRLKKKLSGDGQASLIETVHGSGYRFLVD